MPKVNGPKPPQPPKAPPTPVNWTYSRVVPLGEGDTVPGSTAGTPEHGGGFGAGAPGVTNTTDVQPDMRFAIDEMKKRYGGDMGAGRAIDIAGGKIREAGLGVERARSGDLARRGISGTGVASNLRSRDADAVLNDIAGAATGITAEAEGRRDAMLQSILGGGHAAGSLAQGDRSLALGTWQANEANQRAKERAALDRQLALLSLLKEPA